MGILGEPGRVQRALGLVLRTASGDAGVGDGPQVCVGWGLGVRVGGTCAAWAVTRTSVWILCAPDHFRLRAPGWKRRSALGSSRPVGDRLSVEAPG